jgi:hypothetical protein
MNYVPRDRGRATRAGTRPRPAHLALTGLRSLTDAEVVADFHCREGRIEVTRHPQQATAATIALARLDAKACQWRLDHIAGYEKSRSWMEAAADLVIDATSLPAADVAERIAKEAEKRIAEAGQPG